MWKYIILFILIIVVACLLYKLRYPIIALMTEKTYVGGGKRWYSSLEKKYGFKVLKEIGSGGNGTVYLVQKNKKKLILKVEKLDVWDKPLTSEYLRQVDFDKVAKKYPNKFMTLVNHGLIENCSYVHPWTHDKNFKVTGDRRHRFDRKNSQTTCYWLLYKPFLDGTFRDVMDKIRTNKKLWDDFLKQMFNIFDVLEKHGYSQNDLNPSNIMYKKIKSKYQWYLIDYGQIWHKKYPESQLDRDLVKRDGPGRNNDALNFITIITPMRSYKKKYDLTFIPFEDAVLQVSKTKEFKQLEKYDFPDNSDKFKFRVVSALYPRKILKIIVTDSTKPWHYLPVPRAKIEKVLSKYHHG